MAARDLYEKDFYKVLGVSKTASADEIKKTYRKLARDLHPDQNKGDAKKEEQFKEVSEAYDILSDAKKRAEYDEARSLFERGGMPRGGQGQYQGDFGDIFGGGAGRSRGGAQVYRGADLRYNLDISLEQAANGFDTTIRVPSWDSCDTCHGSGAKPGTSPMPKQKCAPRPSYNHWAEERSIPHRSLTPPASRPSPALRHPGFLCHLVVRHRVGLSDV